ncbi:MAG TPA: hypothetical protein DDY13_11320 [Cytophagales bacterium]|nr:hypothetical protein [Cytophagales bacterium]
MLLVIGTGIALTVFGLLILFGMIGAGILSASILVGLNKKSFSKGFKTFLVSASTIGGLLIGVAGLWILNEISQWWPLNAILSAGSIVGLLSGFLFGLFAYNIVQRMTVFLKTKLTTFSNSIKRE